MRLHFVFFLILSLPLSLNLQANELPELSDDAEISILTYEPGEEIYSLFGHSAIRIKDAKQHIDWVYNYGTFDFNTSHFYLKFIRGNLNYQLARASYRRVTYNMLQENRTVYEQQLFLTQHEKQELFKALEINYLPNNRYYLYNFFFDNCATRIHDIIYEALDSTITFNSGKYRELSFRDILNQYTGSKYWLKNGINILLGKNADKVAKPIEYMFIPDYVMEIYSHMKIKRDNDFEFLTSAPRIIFQSTKSTTAKQLNWQLILYIFSGVIFLASVLAVLRNRKPRKWIRFLDVVFLFSSGFVGLTLIALWAGSMHEGFENNWNILWLNPLNLVILFTLFKEKWKSWIRYLTTFNVLLLLAVLFAGNAITGQELAVISKPAALLLTGRFLHYLRIK